MFFRMLYQMPMENIETKHKYKPLNISVLKELWSYTPWKIIHESMERPFSNSYAVSRNKIKGRRQDTHPTTAKHKESGHHVHLFRLFEDIC